MPTEKPHPKSVQCPLCGRWMEVMISATSGQIAVVLLCVNSKHTAEAGDIES